jgi:hypothetical protein
MVKIFFDITGNWKSMGNATVACRAGVGKTGVQQLHA